SAMRRSRADRTPALAPVRRSQQRLASRPAAALDQSVSISVVVVRQLLSPPNGTRRADPDRALDDMNVAVRTAAVIDEAGNVAADARIDDRAVRQLEAPDVSAPDVAALALEALLVGNLLAGVMNDALVLRNRLCRVDAPPLDFRTPLLDHHL